MSGFIITWIVLSAAVYLLLVHTAKQHQEY